MSQVNIENIDISQTLPVIGCDYDGLKNWALAYVSRYKDLVITEDQVKEIKKDMAEINKAKQRIDKARIEAVKAVSAPIKAFETKIKEICGIFDDAYNSLGNQVKEFEETERKQKRNQIQSMIEVQIKGAEERNPIMAGRIMVDIPAKWLNKTYSLKSIDEEIHNDIKSQIERDENRRQFEKAQSERRLLIENAVKAANEKYNTDLPLYPFLEPPYTDIEKDAAAILALIEIEAQDHSEMVKAVADRNLEKPNSSGNEAISVAPTHDVSNVKINDIPLQPEPARQENRLIFRFTATFTPDQEEQVKEILNRNNFLKIKRQLDSIGVKTIVERS